MTKTAYSPHTDSSAGYPDYGFDAELFARDPKADNPGFDLDSTVILVVSDGGDFKLCNCGCGSKVTNSQRSFVQGHDQRLIGILTRAAVHGTEVAMVGGEVISGEALGMAAHFGLTDKGIAKLTGAVEVAMGKRDRKQARKAAAVDDSPADRFHPTIEAGRVKVGRWFYSAVRFPTTDEVIWTAKDNTEHQADAKIAATFTAA